MLSVSQDAGDAAVLHSGKTSSYRENTFTGHGDCRHAFSEGGGDEARRGGVSPRPGL